MKSVPYAQELLVSKEQVFCFLTTIATTHAGSD